MLAKLFGTKAPAFRADFDPLPNGDVKLWVSPADAKAREAIEAAVHEGCAGVNESLSKFRDDFRENHPDAIAGRTAGQRAAGTAEQLVIAREKLRAADTDWRAAVAAGDSTADIDRLRVQLRNEVEDLTERKAILVAESERRAGQAEAAVESAVRAEHGRQLDEAKAEYEAARQAVADALAGPLFRFMLANTRFNVLLATNPNRSGHTTKIIEPVTYEEPPRQPSPR